MDNINWYLYLINFDKYTINNYNYYTFRDIPTCVEFEFTD